MKRYRINKDTFWEETGKIIVHNYPASSKSTYSYITRVFREFKRDVPGWREVEGKPHYFHELPLEVVSMAKIMAEAEAAINYSLEKNDVIVPMTEEEYLKF